MPVNTPPPKPKSRSAGEDIEPAARVLRKFRIVFNAVKTHFQQVEKRAGIGGAQLWALSVIRDQPGIGTTGLALTLDIHQTTASNLIKALLAMGLVGRRREGPDRRTVQLHVLPAGTQLLRKAPGPLQGVLPDALARLDARAGALDRDLAGLINALAANETAAGVPLGQR